ncbi:hypothetical protein R5R35_000357 [Gryllus longicercus]|uniref:Nuclear pore protein n=2 Tax=Gryllus longicercus TaxID=2509291 RepID=A0AAN9Z978_9ORTH
MAESDFNALLHAAEQLSAEVDGSRELPKVERSLRQVLEASTELWSRVTQTGAQDLQAHVLLGSKGVDLPQLSQKLETLSTRKTFEPLEPVPEADIQTFLKNELENAILSIIEETNRTSFETAEHRMWDDVNNRWRQEKLKALNALLGSSDEMLGIAARPEVSIINDGSISSRSQLDDQQSAYASAVTEYNRLAVQGALRPSLIDRFHDAVRDLHENKAMDLWNMVACMTEIPPQSLGDPLKARATSTVEQTLITQARKFLENRYKVFMRNKVECNLQEARRGGRPGTLPLVICYAKLQQVSVVPGLEEVTVDGQPLWPVVYFCLRSGEPGAALTAASQAGSALEEFVSVLKELEKSPDRRLSTHLEQNLRFHYQRSVRASTDPFKKVVYCALGACDTAEEHTFILKTADDYLWMKLCQIREDNSQQPGSDSITYPHLQSLILEEYGEKHYNASAQPLLYFQMLFLTGQFEAAVEFLSRQDRLRTHAIHIALALSELQLLALPHSIQAPLLSSMPDDRPPLRRLNLARLLMLYVRRFESSDPKEALQYYYFLRNIKTPEGQNLFMLCISDLVMEARNFDLVLGSLSLDGCRIPGLIDSFQGVQADAKQIIELVASEAERKGLLEDAIHLYVLAGNHEKVLTLLTTLLAQVVQQINSPGSVRARLQELAASVSARYEGQHISCSSQTSSAFFTLRDLLVFFDQYNAGEHQLALETISRAKLIPLSMAEMEERVGNFRRLSDEVCRAVPEVLLATMNILYSMYNHIKTGGTSSYPEHMRDSTKEMQLNYLREKARSITTFAGTVPYHMPGDTNSRLVQIEILMN